MIDFESINETIAKMVNAERVLRKENSQFREDRPPSPIHTFKIDQ